MRIGIFAGESASSGTIDDIVHAAHTAAAEGFSSFWLPQIFGADAITVAGVIGREVPALEVGTAVVPTYPRHPLMLAQQALTANGLCGGHFTLGIGLSHQLVIETIMGLSFEKPLRHMREYLSILRPLIHDRAVDFTGETMRTQAAIDIKGAEPCPILIAALGPKMLALAGELAEGTITWMTGTDTLTNHTIPAITASAEAHGRPAPRIAAGIPICVTDDPDGARQRAAGVFAVYGILPSYRAMLDREGLAGPADLALVGGEDEVSDGIERYAASGVTDFLAVEFGDPDELHRTREHLRGLL
ncbi:MAG: LLM class F420-dependent oxidoreductase [Acidimicrobiales bacterium]